MAALSPTGMVMVWPLDSVTTSGEPVTGLLTDTVYVTAPPSAAVAVEAVTLTVVAVLLSVTVVTTGVPGDTAGNSLPVVPATPTLTGWLPWA
ncbi:hypothetical protein ASC87_21480 [Rhizobacter sp. Root1221]|nr:hypothetical protein ASC87_21480 [Rhizobacter sp. Root1221]